MELFEEISEYICREFGAAADRPFQSSPDALAFRAAGSAKWFALLMRVPGRKLGLETEGPVWALDLKGDPDFIVHVTSQPGFLPAYHMNRRNWLTVLLDGSADPALLKNCIAESYRLVNDTPSKRIYEAVKRIPKGKVASYGRVAELAGNPKMSRAVGNALHRNPDPENIPCYRVVNAKGELAGAFAFGGERVQEELLLADGIEVVNGRVDLSKYGF